MDQVVEGGQESKDLGLSNDEQEDNLLEDEQDTDTVLGKDEDAANACRWEGCYEVFATSADLGNHLKVEHVDSVKRKKLDMTPVQTVYACLWRGCNRFSMPQASKALLMSHVRSHAGEKPFVCPQCQQRFSRSEPRNKHIKTKHTSIAQTLLTLLEKPIQGKRGRGISYSLPEATITPSIAAMLQEAEATAQANSNNNPSLLAQSDHKPNNSLPPRSKDLAQSHTGNKDSFESISEVPPEHIIDIAHKLSNSGIPIIVNDSQSNMHLVALSDSLAVLDHPLGILDQFLFAKYYVEYTENRDLRFELGELTDEATLLENQIDRLREVIWPLHDSLDL
jgi:hypothetical protein